MRRIILGGSMNPLNKGDQARVKATIRKLTEDNDVRLAILSHCFAGDKRVYSEDAIEIVKAPWAINGIKLTRMAVIALLTLIKYSLFAFAHRVLGLRIKAKLLEYDALVIISGIDFSDFAGRWPIYYSIFLTTLFGIVMRKPVMCYAQSMGPIENFVMRRLARSFLNRMRIISVREENSLIFLRELKVNRPTIYFTADPAFLLQPIYTQSSNILEKYGIQNTHRPLIGLSLRPVPFAGPGTGYCSIGLWYRVNKEKAERLSTHYIQRMARICDRLICLYRATLVFVPNCTEKGDDYRECMKKVQEQMFFPDRGICITDDITLSESMEIISACDLFIGTRLHADIVAAITGVPLVPLVGTDEPRIPGVMKMLGLDNCVCNIVTAEESHIMSVISGVWNNRQEIRRITQSKVSEVRGKALDNVSVFREFCSQDGGSFIPVPDEVIAA